MRSFPFFLLANSIIFLLVLLHLIGYFLGNRVAETESEQQMYYLLENLEIEMLGIYRTYDDLIKGYSLIFAVTTLFFGIFNLTFFHYVKNHLPLYRSLLLLNILLWGIELTIFITYLVFPTILLTSLILILFLISYFLIGKKSKSG